MPPASHVYNILYWKMFAASGEAQVHALCQLAGIDHTIVSSLDIEHARLAVPGKPMRRDAGLRSQPQLHDKSCEPARMQPARAVGLEEILA